MYINVCGGPIVTSVFQNPFRPGAGHPPPYLAGREQEKQEFQRLLQQQAILDNLVLTGLRGVGKTVLLNTLEPMAIPHRWLWLGNDLSEAASLNEENLTTRLCADLAVATAAFSVGDQRVRHAGLTAREETTPRTLNFETLRAIWNGTPGLASDKLKAVLETAWEVVRANDIHGIVFAYDEAQNLANHPDQDQHPLSLLLDVFQSIQRKGIPFMLVLAGLPTLFPRLVEARTFAERMFHVVTLDRLSRQECDDAVLKPIEEAQSPVRFTEESVQLIYEASRGYPYFVQYLCKEAFDVWTHKPGVAIPINDIMRKLDADFFAGRWARATDRQRDLLTIIAHLENSAGEFTVQDILAVSKRSPRPFSASHVSQMLAALGEAGLVYKNRWGRYSLAVPLLDAFIRRQAEEALGRG